MLVAINYDDSASVDRLIDIAKFSDFKKLLRVTSYVLRFINNTRKKVQGVARKSSKYVTAEEMTESHTLWIKANQSYAKQNTEYKQLKIQLNCKTDENGIMRSYGRMKHSNLPENTKAPILLVIQHRLSILIVLYSHSKVMHRGVKQTLCESRTNYWIPKGRHFVKKVI